MLELDVKQRGLLLLDRLRRPWVKSACERLREVAAWGSLAQEGRL